jgi:arylsulfatase A
MVVKMDDRVGRVVGALERLGVRRNTLIVYLTDNGTAAKNLIDAEGDQYVYEPVVSRMGSREIPGGKGTMTDRGTRVPMIINWPATIQRGQVDSDLAHVSDLLPSLVHVAGAELPEAVQFDGRPLRSLVPGALPRRWVFSEHEGRCFVRNQRWKLYSDGHFYDVEADPEETKPLKRSSLQLAAAVAHQELKQALDDLDYRAE